MSKRALFMGYATRSWTTWLAGPAGWRRVRASLVCLTSGRVACIAMMQPCLYCHTGIPPTNRALLPATTVALRDDGGVFGWRALRPPTRVSCLF